jgi:hypothetical protein
MGTNPTPSGRPETPTDSLLATWQERALLALFAYNRAANRCRTWNTGIGLVVAVLSAVVGTSVFASFGQSVSTRAKILVGSISLLAAVMSGIQAFAALPQRIDEYEKAARRFGIIRREIEQIRTLTPASQIENELSRMRAALDAAAEVSPNAPRNIWNKTRRHVKGEYTWWEVLLRRLRGLPVPTSLAASVVHQSRS